jgi:head-tail adaptor
VRISAGLLDRRVTLLAPVSTLDAMGGPVETYQEAGKRWCSRLRYDPRGVDRDAQRQTAAGVNLLLRLDSLTDTITSKWRVVFDGQELEIAGLERTPADGSLIISGQQPTT